MPKVGNWLIDYGSWEGFLAAVEKSTGIKPVDYVVNFLATAQTEPQNETPSRNG